MVSSLVACCDRQVSRTRQEYKSIRVAIGELQVSSADAGSARAVPLRYRAFPAASLARAMTERDVRSQYSEITISNFCA
jgi:hypothetical protein